MLFARSALFVALQLAVAFGAWLGGAASPVTEAARWWLWYVTAANVACVALLARFARAEGTTLRRLYGWSPATWKGDLKWLALALFVSGPLAQGPNTLLARLLWDDPATPARLLFRPLPVAAVVPLLVLMPLTHAFAELPTYWAYAAPGLRRRGMGRWAAILLVGTVLSLQHAAMGFLPDWRFNLWHGVMFLPFAIWTGWLIDRRPSLLPYMMATHALIDASLPLMTLSVSRGNPL
jgi:hypothetical protein